MRKVADILEGVSDRLVSLDGDWRVIDADPAAARLWGVARGEVAARSFFDCLSADPDNAFRAGCMTMKETGAAVALTAHSDIFDRWLELRGYPNSGGYALLCRDVTQERDAHRALIEREREFDVAHVINQRIFETSLDLILVVGRHGDFIRVSPSSAAILGYQPEEMIGHNGIEFIHPGDLESTRNEMRLARRGRVMRNFDSRYLHKLGRVVPLAWTGVWSEPEQQHFFIGRDMTERVAAEERLRRAQRLDAVGQLTGGIAHDFNNLLAVDDRQSRSAARAGRGRSQGRGIHRGSPRRRLAGCRVDAPAPRLRAAPVARGRAARHQPSALPRSPACCAERWASGSRSRPSCTPICGWPSPTRRSSNRR